MASKGQESNKDDTKRQMPAIARRPAYGVSNARQHSQKQKRCTLRVLLLLVEITRPGLSPRPLEQGRHRILCSHPANAEGTTWFPMREGRMLRSGCPLSARGDSDIRTPWS